MTRPLGSTYRLQLSGVGFARATELVGYLAELGVETLYLSPVLAAAPGSTHGYDVIDPTELDPSLGTRAEFDALLDELEAHDMRVLLDIVPNHMAAVAENRWWWEVLREGSESEHAVVFDIDWSAQGGRVLVPTLGRSLADVLDDGTVEISSKRGERILTIDGQAFPVASGSRGRVSTILGRQHYRPAFWRVGRVEGNYRRFFDIDGLVGMRVEDPEVFDRTHSLIADLVADERVAGVRVDHIDGLTDPRDYADRLTRKLATGRASSPVVLVEKIVARDEALPSEWEVDGTTGYEFGDVVGGLFVDGDGVAMLEALGRELTGELASFASLVLAAKGEVLADSFPGQLDRIARDVIAALDEDRPGHDVSLAAAREALAGLTVHLGVYRTYIDRSGARPADAERLRAAAAAASSAGRSTEGRRALDLIVAGLEGVGATGRSGAWLQVAERWQQLSGAVMAKGVEDTATYRYSGGLSHAEVGCDPSRPAAALDDLIRLAADHLQRPASLNATSTHDSKRSADVRSRLLALTGRAQEWAVAVRQWHDRYGSDQPDAHDELVIYQTLAGVWSFQSDDLPASTTTRVCEYVVKAARESKRHTSWVDQDGDYEAALVAFVERLARSRPFNREMSRFVSTIAPAAASISLAMVVLKCVLPGVPDIYQGDEAWSPSLTDPDNRRLVDVEHLSALLTELGPRDGCQHLDFARMLREFEDGRVKLHVTRQLLQLRRTAPALFDDGAFDLLPTSDENVLALSRTLAGDSVVAVVARRPGSVASPGRFPLGRTAWGEAWVDAGASAPASAPASAAESSESSELTEILTNRSVPLRHGRLEVADCLADLPVAVLVGRD